MRNTRAFTLLEVLLAVMIVVILTATMSATINISFRLKRSAEHSTEMMRDMEIAGDAFVLDLRSVVLPSPITAADYDPTTAPPPAEATTVATAAGGAAATGGVTVTTPGFLFGSFIGENNQISFYTTGLDPKDPTLPDVHYEELAIDDTLHALVRRVNTNLLSEEVVSNNNLSADLQQEVLVFNVRSLVFRYYDGSEWTDSWDSTQIMPSATFTGGTQGQTPVTSGTTGTTGTATPTTPTNSTGIALPVAVSMELTLDGVRPEDPPRVITRYAAVMCAVPADADVTGTATGDFGSNIPSGFGN